MNNSQLIQYLEVLDMSGVNELFTISPFRFLEQKVSEYKNCKKCQLHTNRNNFVYGEGNSDAKMMIIGEGPGKYEDETGKPFVGESGQLLTKMLNAINISRKEVYITNVVKCRPPSNRNPDLDEVACCIPYLHEQIDIVKPSLILILGKVAANAILKNRANMSDLRKEVFFTKGIRTFVTYHPSALLRNTKYKKPAWIDLQKIQKVYEAN